MQERFPFGMRSFLYGSLHRPHKTCHVDEMGPVRPRERRTHGAHHVTVKQRIGLFRLLS